ncbi:MAG TPA: FHA domain-containing protein [Methylomirabilota bacterium]|nr:FHA domain-containing protein [Methylomirabilota bacterium]
MIQVSLQNVANGAEFPLKAGVNRLGRAEDNDIQLPVPSISSHHCEIVVSDSTITIQDLGSTNGTQIAGTKIQHGTLQPGQTVRLGEVDFYVRAAGGPAPIQPPAQRAPLVVASSHSAVPVTLTPAQVSDVLDLPPVDNACAVHPQVEATLSCTKCGKQQCTQCVRSSKVGSKTLLFCNCGGQCSSISDQRAAAVAGAAAAEQSTYGSALKYPFKRDGLILLALGAVFFLVLELLQLFPVGLVRWAAFIFGYGYLFGYMQQIVSATAHGEDDPPGWPDFSDYGQDIVHPFLLLAGTVVVTILPAALAFIFISPLLGLLLGAISAALFPMALLGVLMGDSFANLNPLFLLNSILKVPGSYAFACFVLLCLMTLSGAVQFAAQFVPVPFVPALIAGFVSFYFTTVYMRVLGLFYRRNRRTLGWV